MNDTVEPRYVELGNLELPAISNRLGFPLDLLLFSQSFTMGYLELGYLEQPAISNYITFRRNIGQNRSGSAVKAPRSLTSRCTESWEMYWRVYGNESKVKLTELTTANTEGDKLPVFVNFRDQTITPEIWRQPRYLEPPLSRTVSRCPWEFEIAGFYCILFPSVENLQAVIGCWQSCALFVKENQI